MAIKLTQFNRRHGRTWETINLAEDPCSFQLETPFFAEAFSKNSVVASKQLLEVLSSYEMRPHCKSQP